MISKETIVPIVLGVALSGLSTLMSFAYSSIDEMNEELIAHRLLLSKLISPDGVIIQSPTSATSKQALTDKINELEMSIVGAGKDEFSAIKERLAIVSTRIDYIEKHK